MQLVFVCQSHLDRAVVGPLRVEGEPLPGLAPVHRKQLRGGGRGSAPNEEEPLLQHCAGVGRPRVEGVLVVEPASPGRLVAGGFVTDRGETLEEVHGGAQEHDSGKLGESAAGPQGPHLG